MCLAENFWWVFAQPVLAALWWGGDLVATTKDREIRRAVEKEKLIIRRVRVVGGEDMADLGLEKSSMGEEYSFKPFDESTSREYKGVRPVLSELLRKDGSRAGFVFDVPLSLWRGADNMWWHTESGSELDPGSGETSKDVGITQIMDSNTTRFYALDRADGASLAGLQPGDDVSAVQALLGNVVVLGEEPAAVGKISVVISKRFFDLEGGRINEGISIKGGFSVDLVDPSKNAEPTPPASRSDKRTSPEGAPVPPSRTDGSGVRSV